MSIVLPVGIDVLDWAASLVIDFPRDDVPRLDDPSAWQQWAERLLQSPSFLLAPRPDAFSDWRSWAESVCLAVG